VRGPVLERYEIVGELGQGGMSVVYRARDRQLARDVAVKVLHEFLARQPDARKRFHREAVAVAKLHHPGILEIFDYSGPDAKDTYIVTELIEGETLRDFIERHGRLPYPELGAVIVLELVRALRHAHEQSVIHRDLKPENVMITRDGSLKLMDFGLAQMMDGGTRLTATGTLLGSPAHMAPEVIDGKSSDARADIFSMGTILYWLTTGRLPFEAPNPSALFKKILDGKYEEPQMLEPRIGNQLARIIKKALEAEVETRYQDVTEVHADLLAEIESVDLSPPDAIVKALLKDPEGFSRALGPKLVATLAAGGRQALKERNVARAMDRFNRVLAIDPDHHEVRELVARVGRRRLIQRRVRQAAAAVALTAGIAGVAYGAVVLVPHPTEAEAERRVDPPPAGTNSSVAAEASFMQSAPSSDPPKAEPEGAPAARKAIAKAAPSKKEPKKGAPPVVEEKRVEVEREPEKAAPPPDPTPPKPAPTITVRIGNGFAESVFIDGTARGHSVYKQSFEVTPGQHLIEVRYMNGKDRPRLVDVSEDGKVFEIAPGGDKVEIGKGILDYRAPPH
jgi:serine/threonine-protein kinase